VASWFYRFPNSHRGFFLPKIKTSASINHQRPDRRNRTLKPHSARPQSLVPAQGQALVKSTKNGSHANADARLDDTFFFNKRCPNTGMAGGDVELTR